MYRPDLDKKSKGGAIALALGVNGALLLAFLHMSGKVDLTDPEAILQTISIIEPEPPRPDPPPPPTVDLAKAKPKQKEGGSSPKNIKSVASEVKAEKALIPVPSTVTASETPKDGAQVTQGASDVAGPGTGSGGVGIGTGSGQGGNGPGGGGGGGGAPAALVRGITGREYPREIMRQWPRGAAIFLRLRIEANGQPSRCDVMRGFGNPSADQWTCSLIMQRGQFRPARDAAGRPIAAWFGYVQRDTGR